MPKKKEKEESESEASEDQGEEEEEEQDNSEEEEDDDAAEDSGEASGEEKKGDSDDGEDNEEEQNSEGEEEEEENSEEETKKSKSKKKAKPEAKLPVKLEESIKSPSLQLSRKNSNIEKQVSFPTGFSFLPAKSESVSSIAKEAENLEARVNSFIESLHSHSSFGRFKNNDNLMIRNQMRDSRLEDERWDVTVRKNGREEKQTDTFDFDVRKEKKRFSPEAQRAVEDYKMKNKFATNFQQTSEKEFREDNGRDSSPDFRNTRGIKEKQSAQSLNQNERLDKRQYNYATAPAPRRIEELYKKNNYADNEERLNQKISPGRFKNNEENISHSKFERGKPMSSSYFTRNYDREDKDGINFAKNILLKK